MRKLSALLLLVPFIMASCSNDNNEEIIQPGEKGSLSLTPALDLDVEKVGTRAPLTSFTGYKLVLAGAESKTIDCPSDGKVENLTPGDYTLTLHNLTDDFVPAFDAPRYSGSETAKIEAGKNTAVSMTLKQANAGVYFVYDESLTTAGLTNVVPTVTQSDKTLVYPANDGTAKGYFLPGAATVSVKNGETVINIGGQPTKELDLKAGELWKLTLKMTRLDGDMTITAEIDTTPTDKEADIDLDIDVNVPTYEFSSVSFADYFRDELGTGTGYFNMTFKNDKASPLFETFSIEGFMPLAANGTLPVGTYTYEAFDAYTGAESTFLGYHEVNSQPAGTYYTAKLAESDPVTVKQVKGGSISVTKDGANYTIVGTFTDQDGVEFKCTYSGAVTFVDVNNIEEYSFTLSTVNSATYDGVAAPNVGSITVQMTSELDYSTFKGYELKVRFFGPIDGNKIAEGTYNINTGVADNFSFEKGGAESGLILPTGVVCQDMLGGGQFNMAIDRSGTINVAFANDKYTITADLNGTNLKSRRRVHIVCSYTGAIDVQ